MPADPPREVPDSALMNGARAIVAKHGCLTCGSIGPCDKCEEAVRDLALWAASLVEAERERCIAKITAAVSDATHAAARFRDHHQSGEASRHEYAAIFGERIAKSLRRPAPGEGAK